MSNFLHSFIGCLLCDIIDFFLLSSEGIRPSPDYTTVPYSEFQEQLQTGDIVLFSGATTTGAIIKMFDRSVFSHVGIVSTFFFALSGIHHWYLKTLNYDFNCSHA